jgi:hypothetical protein
MSASGQGLLFLPHPFPQSCCIHRELLLSQSAENEKGLQAVTTWILWVPLFVIFELG